MIRIAAALTALVVLAAAAPAPAPPETNAARNARLSKEGAAAQKATDAKYKRWDDRMNKTMGGVCKGC